MKKPPIACRIFGHEKHAWQQYGTPRFIGRDALGTSHYALEFNCRRCNAWIWVGRFHKSKEGKV